MIEIRRGEHGTTYFVNKPYAVNEDACFLYGDCYQKRLEPCEPITDTSICIGRLDNSNLKASRFMIGDYDRMPIRVEILAKKETKELTLPGKSTFVLLQPEMCDKMFIHETVREAFKKDSDRSDHVHVTTVAKIEEAGWRAFYAPIQLNFLFDHVRLVCKRTILNGEDPTENDAESLRAVFTLIPNLHG